MKKIFAISLILALFVTQAFAIPSQVVPIGRTAGIAVMYDGVLVAGLSQVDSTVGFISPAQEIGITQGDIITEVNGIKITSNENISYVISESNGKEISIKYLRQEQIITDKITPVLDNIDNTYKIGIWIRDSCAGIGTITYIDPETNVYGGLGHSISDYDTGETTKISQGTLIPSSVENVVRGEVGKAGELSAQYSTERQVGTVNINTNEGIFGTSDSTYFEKSNLLDVADFSEITEGEAYILTNVALDTVQTYEIKIMSIFSNEDDNKNFLIEIVDEDLIEITGGIVQGMSGSPIIQNGKIVGAVTHVLVNDPKTGYGIYIGNMLETAEEIIIK